MPAGEERTATESQFLLWEPAALNAPVKPTPKPGLSEAILELHCYKFFFFGHL